MSLTMEQFAAFETRLLEHAGLVLKEEDFRPSLSIDAYIDPRPLDMGLMEEWEQLEPFGEANPQPSLATRDVICTGVRRIGKDQTHLKLTVEHGTDPEKWRADCVAWGACRGLGSHHGVRRIDQKVAYLPTVNNYNGPSIAPACHQGHSRNVPRTLSHVSCLQERAHNLVNSVAMKRLLIVASVTLCLCGLPVVVSANAMSDGNTAYTSGDYQAAKVGDYQKAITETAAAERAKAYYKLGLFCTTKLNQPC